MFRFVERESKVVLRVGFEGGEGVREGYEVEKVEGREFLSRQVLGPYAKGFKYDRKYRKEVKTVGGEKESLLWYTYFLEKVVAKDIYWEQRFKLFAKYDEGILLDKESFYSVTPQRIAEHIADRVTCDVVLDLFSGCGGNSIQFAKTCQKVIAVEIDPSKIMKAKHNAKIYNTLDKITFITANVLDYLDSPVPKINTLFLSPPWGGPDYKNYPTFLLSTCLIETTSLHTILIRLIQLYPTVICLLPRNVSHTEVFDVGRKSKCYRTEIEQHFVSGRCKTIAAYFWRRPVGAITAGEKC